MLRSTTKPMVNPKHSQNWCRTCLPRFLRAIGALPKRARPSREKRHERWNRRPAASDGGGEGPRGLGQNQDLCAHRRGRFPKPHRVGAKAVRWSERDIAQWVAGITRVD
ncbi:helix-turn-helix transcriptional regulator [Hankyongella ginsenosidimutans]|uniref:helix-turn-helix transcriptional regulator n=1 Tax=Hankyongella ginsenosidimutans TaxID=1763828 RepID=UPI003CCC493E